MESTPSQQSLRDNDPLYKEYLSFKRTFKKHEVLLGVKIPKSITSNFISLLKPIKCPFKNINPIKHSNNSNENIYITKYTPFDKEALEQYIKSVLSPEQLETYTYSITEETITLTIQNYSYDEILKLLYKEELPIIPGGFEIIGKIAHLNLREQFLKYKYVIGSLILDKNTSIKTVVNKVSKIDNVYRTYEMEVLAGKPEYNVEHKEGNILFKFDLRKTYWCSRLQGERDRVLKLMKREEILCDAFCGVGPLALRACKKGMRVLANDLNPSSYEYLNNNIKINKLDTNMISTFNMDAREFITVLIQNTYKVIDEENEYNFNNKFPIDLHIDHIYMNLPKDAIEFLDVFVGLFRHCKENVYHKDNLPIVHVYAFAKVGESNPQRELKERIAKAFKMELEEFEDKCKGAILNIENVRDISNKKVVFCVDMRIPAYVAYKK